MTSSGKGGSGDHDSFIQTLQSLIVAFVLAMTFRGFVTEGFVIPTGSMAPTLMGQHLMVHSRDTGAQFTVGLDPKQQVGHLDLLRDPMLGPQQSTEHLDIRGAGRRMGDRILVLKTLYPFNEPDRFDVVVFKNPTNPNSESGNYIKRLIGLPNEKIWLVDGDVFAGSAADPTRLDDYEIQRKPEHVQRAVWQPISSSDLIPGEERGDHLLRWKPMWVGDSWAVEGPTSRTDETGRTTLRVENRALDDWAPYNMLSAPSVRSRSTFPTADLRVAAGIVPEASGLVTTLELRARGHLYLFTIDFAKSQARLEIVPDDNDTSVVSKEVINSIDLPEPGEVIDVEFWHVDQKMWMFIDGKLVAELEYDWKPVERLEQSHGVSIEHWKERFPHLHPQPVELEWHFQGAPVALHRMRVDRDLYYLPGRLRSVNQLNEPMIAGAATGTHPERPAVLDRDQFFMLGDNSPASSDSRVWGNPHPIVAHQIDPDPFIVNRKLLLGKAWVVYFPAPYPMTEDGRSVIPDFGRLRFIR